MEGLERAMRQGDGRPSNALGGGLAEMGENGHVRQKSGRGTKVFADATDLENEDFVFVY